MKASEKDNKAKIQLLNNEQYQRPENQNRDNPILGYRSIGEEQELEEEIVKNKPRKSTEKKNEQSK